MSFWLGIHLVALGTVLAWSQVDKRLAPPGTDDTWHEVRVARARERTRPPD